MYINFSIINFLRKGNKWDKYFSFHKRLSKYKHLEIEGNYSNYHIFCFEFKISYKEDHAGILFSLNMFCREISLQIYDSRHWNYQNNYWHECSAEDMIKSNFDGF